MPVVPGYVREERGEEGSRGGRERGRQGGDEDSEGRQEEERKRVGEGMWVWERVRE